MSPGVEPKVTAAWVRSTVLGEQTAAGVLITTTGKGLIVTVTLVLVRLSHPLTAFDSA